MLGISRFAVAKLSLASFIALQPLWLEPTAAEDATPSPNVKGSPASPLNQDFLRFEPFEKKYVERAQKLPVDTDSYWAFAIVKLILIMTAVLIWLRVLHLRTVDEDDEDLESGFWTGTLVVTGPAGMMVALLSPAYVAGACILIATSIVPFAFYQRWRNQHSIAPTDQLRWKHLWVPPVIVKKAKHTTPVELPSGITIGTSNSVIKLIERSAAERANFGSHASQHSAGFQTVLALIDHSSSHRVTDLHINSKDDGVVIRQRVDGSLNTLTTLPEELGQSVINVIKVLSNLSIADRRRSQDGSFRADVNDQRLSFRVSSQGIHAGEKLSIRILDPAKNFADLSTLGMLAPIQERFKTALNRSNGVILFVGATGAGKSTTACAALQSIDADDRSVISIEDPIEYQIPSVDQIEVNHRAGQTFDSTLRSILRQDADVIFIGEIRDEESARIGCRAALTGQLVLATMHSNDATAGLVRLIELGINLQDVATSLRVVIAQTLVRKLCTNCRVPHRPDAATLEQLGISDFEGELFQSPDASVNPCLACNGRGFLRRTALFEFLEVTPEIRDQIRERAAASAIEAVAKSNGMQTIREEGLRLVREGIISVNELQRISDGP